MLRRACCFSVLFFVLHMVVQCSAFADDLHVPSQYPTIQAAIDAAVDGDEVVIAPGVYRESLSVTAQRALTIRSIDPSDPGVVAATILTGDNDDDGLGDAQILVMDVSDDSDLVVRGLTFVDGYSSLDGGAIEIAFTVDTQILIEDCVFENNEAIEDGGAVYFAGRSTLKLNRIDFRHNIAGGGGGAVRSFGQLDIVERCRFHGNSSNSGALALCGTYLSNQYPAYVTNCEFVGNVMQENSAVLVCGRRLEIVACTFAENQAGSSEGTAVAMYPASSNFGRLVASHVTIWNTIVAPRRDQLPFNSLGNTNFMVNDSIALPFWEGERVIHADPMFIRYPSDGGDGWGDDPMTSDVDESGNDDFGDLRLLLASPAIDAGNNDRLPADGFDQDADGDLVETSPFDLYGLPRKTDVPGVVDSGIGMFPIVDIGAHEFQPIECLADVNADGQLSPTDFTAWINAFNNSQPRCDQNADNSCTPTDFTAWINNFNTGCSQ